MLAETIEGVDAETLGTETAADELEVPPPRILLTAEKTFETRF